MKILVVTPKYYPDNFAIIPLVDAFVKSGHDVTVLTSMPFDENGKHLEEYKNKELEINDKIIIYRLKTIPRKKSKYSIALNYLSFYFKAKKWAKKCQNKYDAIYTFEVSPVTTLIAGNIYKKKYKVPHIVHVLDVWPASLVGSRYYKEKSLIYKIMRKWSKSLYLGADELLIGSPSFKQYFKQYLGIKDIPIKYVPQPGLVAKKVSNTNPYPFNTINILYCGNISEVQLVNYFVPSMEKIQNEKVHLTIIGRGRYKDKLLEEIEASPVKERIHYLGEMIYEELYNYHHYSDAIIVSLDNSTFVGKTIPSKLISSMYYGRPIIGMLEGDGEDVLKDSRGSIIVNQSKEGLIKGIESISKMNEKEKVELGYNNQAYYKEHFDINKISEEILISLSRK